MQIAHGSHKTAHVVRDGLTFKCFSKLGAETLAFDAPRLQGATGFLAVLLHPLPGPLAQEKG